MGYVLYDHSWWSNLLDRLGRGSDAERREILQGLAAEDLAVAWYAAREMGLEAPPVEAKAATFSYPPGSRILIAILFWLCILFAVGFLWAVVRTGGEDPGNGWVLFILGLLFLGGAAGHHSRSKWVGRQITIDEAGVREILDQRVTTAIRWDRLSRLRTRYLGGVVLESVDRQRLVIRPVLHGYGDFIMLLGAFLKSLRDPAG